MNEELKQKLTERFDVISSKAECDKDVRDALFKAYLAGGEYGYQCAVEKAVEFLKEKEFGDWIEQEASSFIDDFRKAMEE